MAPWPRSLPPEVAHHPDDDETEGRQPEVDQHPLLHGGQIPAEQEAVGGIAGGAEAKGQGRGRQGHGLGGQVGLL